jgi:hypothetical protein
MSLVRTLFRGDYVPRHAKSQTREWARARAADAADAADAAPAEIPAIPLINSGYLGPIPY